MIPPLPISEYPPNTAEGLIARKLAQIIVQTDTDQKVVYVKALDSFLRFGEMAVDTPLQIQQSPISFPRGWGGKLRF